jgi:hypothetical protein
VRAKTVLTADDIAKLLRYRAISITAMSNRKVLELELLFETKEI